MISRIERDGDRFDLSVNGERVPLYGYMTYLPGRGKYEDFARAGVRLMFVPIYMGDRGINQNTATRPMQKGFWTGEGRYDFTPVEEAFRLASAGGAYLVPRIMTEPPFWWDRAHPEELCRSFQGEPAHASFSSRRRLMDVTAALQAFWDWCGEAGWRERIAAWHLAGGNTEEFLRPTPHPGFLADYSRPAVEAWHAFIGQNIDPPGPLARRLAGENGLRDPEKDSLAIAYERFLSESVAGAVAELCREGKRITGGAIPMGAFYGYLVNVTDPEIGHGAIGTVLASPYVDFLASPFSYYRQRSSGVDWPIPGPVASARLHNKPWLIESDVRTCLTGSLKDACPQAAPKVNHLYEGGVWQGPDTVKGSLSLMKKALGSALCAGTGAWWFDMWGGWYDRSEFMAFHRRAAELFAAPRSGKGADVAVMLSEELIYRNTGSFAARAHQDLLAHMAMTGAAYDVYAMSDLNNIDWTQYRAAVFPGCETAPECPCPVRIVTGCAGEGRPVPGGTAEAENGIICLADPAPEPDILREALMCAGAHIYSFTGDVCCAGRGYVCLHAAAPGVKRIYLPGMGRITDAFTGEVVNVSEAFGEFEMEAGETRLFGVEEDETGNGACSSSESER